jgi:hypothetical protein
MVRPSRKPFGNSSRLCRVRHHADLVEAILLVLNEGMVIQPDAMCLDTDRGDFFTGATLRVVPICYGRRDVTSSGHEVARLLGVSVATLQVGQAGKDACHTDPLGVTPHPGESHPP